MAEESLRGRKWSAKNAHILAVSISSEQKPHCSIFTSHANSESCVNSLTRMPDKILSLSMVIKGRRWDGLDIEIVKSTPRKADRRNASGLPSEPNVIVTARASRYKRYFPEGGQGEPRLPRDRYPTKICSFYSSWSGRGHDISCLRSLCLTFLCADERGKKQLSRMVAEAAGCTAASMCGRNAS